MDKKIQNPNLTEEQRRVLFTCGTEPPFSGKWLANKNSGKYVCANCGSVLFDSKTKFDSGSGWPSFFEPETAKSLHLVEDNSHGMRRIEVRCGSCEAHLGHVFNDAPDQPTGMRFCINSASLDFKKN